MELSSCFLRKQLLHDVAGVDVKRERERDLYLYVAPLSHATPWHLLKGWTQIHQKKRNIFSYHPRSVSNNRKNCTYWLEAASILLLTLTPLHFIHIFVKWSGGREGESLISTSSLFWLFCRRRENIFFLFMVFSSYLQEKKKSRNEHHITGRTNYARKKGGKKGIAKK